MIHFSKHLKNNSNHVHDTNVVNIPEPPIKREPRDCFIKTLNNHRIIIWEWWYSQKETWPWEKIGYELQNCDTGKCQNITFEKFEELINNRQLKFLSRCERR